MISGRDRLDVSSVVGAVLKAGSVPEQALLHAEAHDIFALSTPVEAELVAVLSRPKIVRTSSALRRDRVVAIIRDVAAWFTPGVRVRDCRDPNDDMYLELALAAGAETIVSSDEDLLTLHPWRGIRILRPADYVAMAQPRSSVPLQEEPP